MPYIDKESRAKYQLVQKQIELLPAIETKGDLEYLTFVLMKKFMSTRESRYSTLHEAVYGVAHAQHEFERRFLDKREDAARQKNGDI